MAYKSVSARYAVIGSCSAGYQNVIKTEEKPGQNGRNNASDSSIVEHFSIAHSEKETFESYNNQSYRDTVTNGPAIDDQTSEVIKSKRYIVKLIYTTVAIHILIHYKLKI